MSTDKEDWPLGIARIKEMYLLPASSKQSRVSIDDDAAEGNLSSKDTTAKRIRDEEKLESKLAPGDSTSNIIDGANDESPAKRLKLSGAQKKRMAKERKEGGKWKKEKGMNTNRKFAKVQDDVNLCRKIASGDVCEGNENPCKASHDLDGYLASKPNDIRFPHPSALASHAPFILPEEECQPESADFDTQSALYCPVYDEVGHCRYGFKCRFLGAHLDKSTPKLTLKTDGAQVAKLKAAITEVNYMPLDKMKAVRTRTYQTPITDAYLTELSRQKKSDEPEDAFDEEVPATAEPPLIDAGTPKRLRNLPGLSSSNSQTVMDETPDVPMRHHEKKRLRWKGLTYLAPLTTVGNLPFRRLCVDFGAHITCGEMALATSLLSGLNQEWSLVKKHPSETLFGVQVAGNKPATLGRIAEMLSTEFGPTGRGGSIQGVDFVDVNCGCPIDLIFKSGSGSALLDMPGRLGKILVGMDRALGDIPLTIKIRTGVKDGRNTAHKLMPKLQRWGVGALTIHGRTRQQRYAKLADWNYVRQCVETLRASIVDDEADDAPLIPIFGGGDVYTSKGYWDNLEMYGVDGIMIGRGALIKPWIFTEINERREWDISSRERLEIIRKYAEYGLNHWGSDTQGVNTTRRFLCESLSFQSRYVPLGILESLPRLNDRPPPFKGRDQLETLLASGDSRDWVRISEMFLGPVPEEWHFTPKHKSNAYAGEEEGNG